MSDLPPPDLDPEAFLRALSAQAGTAPALISAASAAGCVVHDLGVVQTGGAAQAGGLHAAGARALAASLARGSTPMLLVSQAGGDAGAYAGALADGLMEYERIYALVCAGTGGSGNVALAVDRRSDGLALILILPPVEPNSFWSR